MEEQDHKPSPRDLTEEELLQVKLMSSSLFKGVSIIVVVMVMILLMKITPEGYFDPVPEEIATSTSDSLQLASEALDGIHIPTGLVIDDNFVLVKNSCTGCHSGLLITQNRATREGWTDNIRWMQETQGLWDLGESEALILDYLEKNYAPVKVGRRAQLSNIEWYDLEE